MKKRRAITTSIDPDGKIRCLTEEYPSVKKPNLSHINEINRMSDTEHRIYIKQLQISSLERKMEEERRRKNLKIKQMKRMLFETTGVFFNIC